MHCFVIVCVAVSVACKRQLTTVRSSACGHLQVMLAQQESIAHLMSLFEAIRAEGQKLSWTPGLKPVLEAVHQESNTGKVRLREDRYHQFVSQRLSACTLTPCLSLMSRASCFLFPLFTIDIMLAHPALNRQD